MPRPRKSLALLELSGALKRDKKRHALRLNEPESSGPVGDPPGYFDRNLRGIWFELVNEAQPGVLTRCDRKLLELTARLVACVRIDASRFGSWLSPLCGVLKRAEWTEEQVEEFRKALTEGLPATIAEVQALSKCLASMGTTPVDRSKVYGKFFKPL